jgi:hypothetical protein
MPPAQLGRSALGFSPATSAVCRCSIEAPLANRKRPSRDCRCWAGTRLGPGVPAPRSQAQLLADLVAVKASLLELADEHARVLGRQLKTPVRRHRDRRARSAEASVARRAPRQLLEVVGEHPVDQLALRECHRSGACQGCAPRLAHRGRRRMPPRRSRPSPPYPRTARLRRRSPPSSTVKVTSRSQCVLRAGVLEPADAAPAARPSRRRASSAPPKPHAPGERDGVGLDLDPASHRPALGPVGGLGGPRPCPIRGPATRLATPSAPEGGTRARP